MIIATYILYLIYLIYLISYIFPPPIVGERTHIENEKESGGKLLRRGK